MGKYREGNRSSFEAVQACRGNRSSFAPFEIESEEACKRGEEMELIEAVQADRGCLNVKSGTRPVFSVKVLIVSNAVLCSTSVPQQDPQKMKMPLKQQQKQATEMPSPKIASNFPNPEIPKLYDPTQSHETTQPEREQKNFPRLPFGLQQQKVAMDPTQNSNRKTEMPSVDHSVSSR
ncbi:hypothetical protein LXL04_033941 [Taraxacum kok-saghyz]